jgi:hypothetical protein
MISDAKMSLKGWFLQASPQTLARKTFPVYKRINNLLLPYKRRLDRLGCLYQLKCGAVLMTTLTC